MIYGNNHTKIWGQLNFWVSTAINLSTFIKRNNLWNLTQTTDWQLLYTGNRMRCHLSTKRRHRKTWERGDCLQSLLWECIWKVTCLFISPLITEVSLREILCGHFFAPAYDEKTTSNSTEMLDFELEKMKERKFDMPIWGSGECLLHV